MADHTVIDGARVEVLFDASHELGEGACWTGPGLGALSNKFVYIDIYGPSKFAQSPAVLVTDPYAADGPKVEAYPLPSPCGTVAPGKDGQSLIVSIKDGFYRVDLATKALTPLAKPDNWGTELRFNDGKAGPDGRFYCGGMKQVAPRACDSKTPAELRHAHLNGPDIGEASFFRMDHDGSLVKLKDGISISNGLAWTQDGATFYYTDTPSDCIYAFDYDQASGNISNQRIAFPIPEGTGHPDGFTIDTQGRLWVAQWGGSRVVCYEPATGKIVKQINFPTSHISSCTFAGPDCSDLIVTTAKENMDAAQRAREPTAGHTFIVRGVGAQGYPAYAFGK